MCILYMVDSLLLKDIITEKADHWSAFSVMMSLMMNGVPYGI